MFCHSPLQWTTFCQTSPPWPVCLGWPHMAWLSFTELDKTVVLWSDWLVFCDYGFSASSVWCPLATPTVLLGFLLTWTWGISSQLIQKGQPPLLTLDEVTPPDLEHGVAPLGPPIPTQLLLIGRRVAPPSRCPWLWTWGSSSLLLLRCRSLAVLVATPDLRHGVTPLGLTSAWSVALL